MFVKNNLLHFITSIASKQVVIATQEATFMFQQTAYKERKTAKIGQIASCVAMTSNWVCVCQNRTG